MQYRVIPPKTDPARHVVEFTEGEAGAALIAAAKAAGHAIPDGKAHVAIAHRHPEDYGSDDAKFLSLVIAQAAE